MKSLTVAYGERVVLDSVDLRACAGEVVAVMGPSGSGKSTLLSAILGLVRSSSGTVDICGRMMEAGLGAAPSRLRRSRIGMVFQEDHLIEELSPVENVIVPALVAGDRVERARERARELLESLGLAEEDRVTSSFSGGERQRIAIARALINGPRLLIADEPTGSLDPDHRDRVMDALTALSQHHGCALLLVTHDPVVARRAHRVVRLEQGRLLAAEGPGR